MALAKILDTINPFSLDLYHSCKELEVWEDMTDNLISCLKKYNLHVGCVSGEANVLLYNTDIYNVIRELNDFLEIEDDKNVSNDPSFCMVAGPILNVEQDNTSVIIELFREGLLELHYSPYRQSEHFRIGNWRKGKENAKKVYIEKPHSLFAKGTSRKPQLIENPKIVKKYCEKLEGLTKNTDEIKMLNPEKDDVNEYFIFLTSEEISKVREQIVKENRRDLYKTGNEKDLSKDFIEGLLKKLPISPREYPDKVLKPWYTMQ